MAEAVRSTRPRRARLRWRLVALVLLVTLPLAALSVVAAVNDRRDATSDAYLRTGEIVSVGVVVARDIVDRTGVLLGTIGQLSNPRGTECPADLGAALVPGTDYRNFYSVDDDGTVTCTAVREPLQQNVADEEWFRTTQEREALSVTVPAPGLTTGDPVMVVSRPRPQPVEPGDVPAEPLDPERPGVLAASFDPQLLVAFEQNIDLPPGSVVQVLDDEGRVVARSTDIERYLLAPAPLFPRIDGSAGGTIEGRGIDGVSRIYSYERMQLGGEILYMLAGISRGEAYSRANQRLVWSLTIILVLGLGVGILALAAARSGLVHPIERLQGAIAGFRAGDVERRAGDIGGPLEIIELGASFDAMADEIQSRLQNQERLLGQLEEATEAERQSIAAGIHDETLQNLSALRIRLQLARRLLDPDDREPLDRTIEMLDDTAEQLRGLLFDLRPPAFDRIGLAATLRETLEVRFGTDLDTWSVVGDAEPDVPEGPQILLYRVAQQALANVRQHANAHRVDIHIATVGPLLTMEVRDDGEGFDVGRIETEARPGHIGLRVMRDRARAAGGEVTIASVPGEGTTIRAEVPVDPASPASADGRRADDPDGAGTGTGGYQI